MRSFGPSGVDVQGREVRASMTALAVTYFAVHCTACLVALRHWCGS